MATLGGRVVDHYGQAERVAFAYALAPEEFWFQPGYACVELVPVSEDGEHILYEIVGTSLWNLAMPLVRYRSGDLIRLPRTLGAAGLEAVRYGLRPFPGVLGRAGDFLVSPDGARLMGIDHLPRGVRNILRMQVVQEAPDHVRILVVPTPAYGGADERDILRNAAGKLPPGMRVGVEVVEELERTPGAKTPFVIRKFPAAESAAGRAGGSR
jgi:phenylacetate-CoA ligase